MVSFFATPKPFVGKTAEHQRNAIRSWLACAPGAEVILFGDAEAMHEHVADLGVQCVSVPCTESGAVTFSQIVEQGATLSKHDLQCYVNCDIMLPNCVERVLGFRPGGSFLIVGERLYLPEGFDLRFEDPEWASQAYNSYLAGASKSSGPTAVDYFFYRKGQWKGLKFIAMGRAYCDGAILAHALRSRIPILDATQSLLAVHQFHGYGHMAGGKQEVWDGSDAQRNRDENDLHYSYPTVADGQFAVTATELSFYPCRGDWLRAVEVFCRFTYRMPKFSKGVRFVWRIRQAIFRSKKFAEQPGFSNPTASGLN
jgi:hypothetical protein